jgi:flagellar biosynthesis chaperone FliJ
MKRSAIDTLLSVRERSKERAETDLRVILAERDALLQQAAQLREQLNRPAADCLTAALLMVAEGAQDLVRSQLQQVERALADVGQREQRGRALLMHAAQEAAVAERLRDRRVQEVREEALRQDQKETEEAARLLALQRGKAV